MCSVASFELHFCSCVSDQPIKKTFHPTLDPDVWRPKVCRTLSSKILGKLISLLNPKVWGIKCLSTFHRKILQPIDLTLGPEKSSIGKSFAAFDLILVRYKWFIWKSLLTDPSLSVHSRQLAWVLEALLPRHSNLNLNRAIKKLCFNANPNETHNPRVTLLRSLPTLGRGPAPSLTWPTCLP